MKTQKILRIVIACFMAITTLSAKDKVIVNPAFEFTNSGILHISKIELGKTETRLHVYCTFLPNWSVNFHKTFYIEDCATGEKWLPTGILNGEFDKEIPMPASGDSTFVLIYPKLDKKVTKINYCEGQCSIWGISLDPKAVRKPDGIPDEVQTWLNEELAKSKRKSLMDFKVGEFFARDTARLVGYIKGYDPRAGFATGMVYTENVITREEYPIVIQIHEDGRFEGNIPMLFPEYLRLIIRNYDFYFYLQPGETLSMLLDWDEFKTAHRRMDIQYKFNNIQFQGATAEINKELTTFYAKLPDWSWGEVYNERNKKDPGEFKIFYDELISGYANTYKQLLETETLSERTKTILKNNFKLQYVRYLFEYEMEYQSKGELPVEFYDFLQDIPMDEKEMLSSSQFSLIINRLEYCSPFMKAAREVYQSMSPSKNYTDYLFEELNIPKTPEDVAYLVMKDSINIKLNQPDMTIEKRDSLIAAYNDAYKQLTGRHGEKRLEEYTKKYVDGVKKLTQREMVTEMWRKRDSIYTNVLKLKPGIVYDITKVRTLDFQFGQTMKNQNEEADLFLKQLEAGIAEPFLIEEAERLFQKNYPLEKKTAYELPDTEVAKLFKEIIAPYKGKYLLVDFWATWCGPCVGSIKQQKAWRLTQKDSEDVDFVFITDESSPVNAYHDFVKENELTNTYRLNEDDYRYLRQLFRFNGIPRYVIVDREGRILNDNARFYSFESKLKEIIEMEENNQP